MILTNTGVLKLMQRIKSYIASQLNTKANSVHTHTLSEIDDLSTLSMGGGYSKSEVDTLLNDKANTSHTHIKSDITDFPSYGTTANTICEGNDSRLSDARTPTSHTHTKSEITDFPTIPTVNNATLTIQKNGTDVKTFTANASSNVTCNITVPTKVSELTNDSNFVESTDLSSVATSGNYADLSNKPSIPVIDSALSSTSTNGLQNKVIKSALDGKANSTHTHSASDITSGLATVATSGSYNDLSNKPTIPTVNNATLTIQKNGTTVKTFTANASSNVTCNITVPTKTSDLTNDSGFLTSHQSLSNYSTLANTIKSLSISGKTITYTKGDNTTGTLTTQDNNTWTAMVGATSSANGSVGYVNAVPPKDGYNTKYLRADGTWQVPPDHTYTVNNATLTIQKNGSNVATFTSNASSNATANITVPTKVSQLTNDSGYITSAVSALEMKGNTPYIDFHASNATRDYTSRIIDDGTADTGRLRITAYYNSTGYQVEMYKNFFEPVIDNDIYLGDSTNRWKTVYAATGTINTSDSRLKNSIKDIDDKLLDAWGNIEPKQYKFNDATESKGEQARFHTGYIAQDIQNACTDNNLDISKYGLFCFDSWDEQPEVTEDVEVEKDGVKTTEKRIVQQKREKGDIYALRYEETLVVECAYLRRENNRLKERLSKIEKLLNI